MKKKREQDSPWAASSKLPGLHQRPTWAGCSATSGPGAARPVLGRALRAPYGQSISFVFDNYYLIMD